MAMSLNGVIARKNGDEDFLSHDNWISFSQLVSSHGNFVIGRKTFETVKKWKDNYSLDEFNHATKVIVSSNKKYKAGTGYSVASSPQEALDLLKSKGFNNILLIGGSELNTSFATHHLIDELIINIESVIIGKGIPLFSEGNFGLNLELIDVKKITKSVVQLRYRVDKIQNSQYL